MVSVERVIPPGCASVLSSTMPSPSPSPSPSSTLREFLNQTMSGGGLPDILHSMVTVVPFNTSSAGLRVRETYSGASEEGGERREERRVESGGRDERRKRRELRNGRAQQHMCGF